MRTFRPQTQDAIERRLSELVHSIAAAFGASATLKYERAYPATINSEREAEFAAAVADAIVGPENVVRDLEPSMGSEDFSFMLQRRRARTQGWCRRREVGASYNSRYEFNDDVSPWRDYMAALPPVAAVLDRNLAENAAPHCATYVEHATSFAPPYRAGARMSGRAPERRARGRGAVVDVGRSATTRHCVCGDRALTREGFVRRCSCAAAR